MNEVTVKRNLEDGYEIIKVKTPCMLTAIKELNTPRYMSIAGIFSAKNKPMHVWSAADVEVDLTTVGLEASPTNVFRSFTPAPKSPGEILEGKTDKEVVEKLLVNLKGKHII
jgi:electron transfer flavoprotein beta subunit